MRTKLLSISVIYSLLIPTQWALASDPRSLEGGIAAAGVVRFYADAEKSQPFSLAEILADSKLVLGSPLYLESDLDGTPVGLKVLARHQNASTEVSISVAIFDAKFEQSLAAKRMIISLAEGAEKIQGQFQTDLQTLLKDASQKIRESAQAPSLGARAVLALVSLFLGQSARADYQADGFVSHLAVSPGYIVGAVLCFITAVVLTFVGANFIKNSLRSTGGTQEGVAYRRMFQWIAGICFALAAAAVVGGWNFIKAAKIAASKP